MIPNPYTGVRGWIHEHLYLGFISPLVSKLTIPTKYIVPIIAVQLGYKVQPDDIRTPDNGQSIYRGWGSRVSFGDSETRSLFTNSMFYVRLMLPFFIGIHIRWAGSDPAAKEFLQTYVGWKLNGDFSVVFRVQSDQSAARGTTSPNGGQAVGWNDGKK